jgi:hypothetical protein
LLAKLSLVDAYMAGFFISSCIALPWTYFIFRKKYISRYF